MIERKKLMTFNDGGCQIVRGNPMFRIIICDDDFTLLNAMEKKIQELFDTKNIRIKVHSFLSVEHISEQLLASCDIALLDIDFPDTKLNGMDLARKLRKFRRDAIIIFVTNFIEYAPEGYEVQAFRYILKSELESELEPYLFQAIEQLQGSREKLKIQINGEIIDLVLEDIIYFEVQQHDVTACVKKDMMGKVTKEYSFYDTLANLEEKLEPLGFLRIHKSYLVNMRYIKKLQCREALLSNGATLRVGEKKYAENKRKYLLWKGWQ